MSYCRWSSDDWKSDVYCYADVAGGYTTHVAAGRRDGNVPPLPWDEFLRDEITPKRFAELHAEQMRVLGELPLVPIGLSRDGESFSDASLGDLRDRLLSLRAEGYHVPDSALELVESEMIEEGPDG